MTSTEDNSLEIYSAINASQESMMIFDVYIVGTVGLTLSTMMLYSLIIANRKNDVYGYYYKMAIKCGITLSIASIILYLLQLLLNDLFIPNSKFMEENVEIISLLDSVILISFLMVKLSLYYGFTFIYLFLFKKDNINKWLKIMMIFAFLSTLIYGLLFFVADILDESFREISVTEKHEIIIASIVNAPKPSSVALDILTMIAILIDLIYVGVLMYYFTFAVKENNNNYYYAVKGYVLLSISSISFIISIIIFIFDSDAKFLLNNISITIDTVCLYLMFNDNDDIYNNLCGCLCGKCCASLCFHSKYIQTIDDDDNNDDISSI